MPTRQVPAHLGYHLNALAARTAAKVLITAGKIVYSDAGFDLCDRFGRDFDRPFDALGRAEYRLQQRALKLGMPKHISGAVTTALTLALTELEQPRSTAQAILRLPESFTADVPQWSPGPDYIEILTAQLWARRVTPNLLHIVSCGDVSDDGLMCLRSCLLRPVAVMGERWGLVTDPYAFYRLALDEGYGQSQEVVVDAAAHPASRYGAAVRRVRDDLLKQLTLDPVIDRALRRGTQLSAHPDGGFQLGLVLDAEPESDDIRSIARALARLARAMKAETNWTFVATDRHIFPLRSNLPRIHPLYETAWSRLQLDRDAIVSEAEVVNYQDF